MGVLQRSPHLHLAGGTAPESEPCLILSVSISPPNRPSGTGRSPSTDFTEPSAPGSGLESSREKCFQSFGPLGMVLASPCVVLVGSFRGQSLTQGLDQSQLWMGRSAEDPEV